MNNVSLRIKFSVVLIISAILLLVVAATGYFMGKQTARSLDLVNYNILPAMNDVLNADRDLYQARVAELEAIEALESGSDHRKYRAVFVENTQQAYDRMQAFKKDLVDFPSATRGLEDFDRRFNIWKDSSQKVFDLLDQGELYEAITVSIDEVHDTFGDLRELYNVATESAEAIAAQVNEDSDSLLAKQNTILITVSVIGFVFALVIAFFLPKVVVEGITAVSDRIKDIAQGDGDLTQRVEVKSQDELGELGTNFNQFVEQLESLIRSVREYADELNTVVVDLTGKAAQSTEIGTEQNQSVEMIATAVNEMAAAIREVANNATHTAEEINVVNTQTEQGQMITQESVAQINRLSGSVQDASDVIARLSEDSEKIASVLDVIRGIAEQTNLLALNAAIEAARAGEQGRGFAVVADEVRTLASKTQQSTEDIQKMIETLQNGVTRAVSAIEQGSGMAAETVQLADQTQQSLALILDSTSKVSEVSVATAASTEQQSHVTEDINRNLTELSDKTRINLETAEQTQSHSNLALQTAQELSNVLSRFKVS
ncbi:methyl-accepting chemotaxis protein [Aliagarivorans taiwanensis]|uniref:methyl-accepting chemotaxis protein n=1 Tax=Aliagarivorans taiwanensis TaxID=561966 RepID=UPI0003F9E495|nr:methyl-accepting chemotaxis protein [Aliagarivorans taiwanensis]